VVLDFGLPARDMAQGTLTGRLFGTVAYMAPEQLEVMRTGKDARTDIYQWRPRALRDVDLPTHLLGKERTSLLEAVRRSRIPSPRNLRKDVPAELADICMRALERDPNRRYASADAFRDDLERWLAGAGALGFTARGRWKGLAPCAQVHSQPSHRHRGAALVLLSTGTALWYAMQPGRS
jgi:serine/threonine protein kinase